MAKTNMLCPFDHKLCDECAVYRGRHYYLSLCKHYRGYIDGPGKNTNSGALDQAVDIKAFDRLIGPWAGRRDEVETIPEVSLRVINMETGETTICKPEETRNWDWGNTEILRIIDGFHVTSWDKLLEILHYKAGKGSQEVTVYEGPRFMLLGGG
jgi:hypothetical protein